ncbi:ferredoxin [Amnibacterium endophyticum]|uniref:Ferredoxin n=1 Tax=Amnibacterium endophyticum TaxID=2109337 RepID=A0ABW4LGP0_9MICO
MSRVVLHVDRTRCDGRGLCMELLPHLIGRDDWGYPLLPGGEATIGPDDEEAAVDAVALCPVLALKLIERR